MSTESDRVADLLPLPPATFHILLALTDQDRHGYAIIQDVEARTRGELRMSAGTLYRSIARMVQQGLITEVEYGTSARCHSERKDAPGRRIARGGEHIDRGGARCRRESVRRATRDKFLRRCPRQRRC